MARDAARIAVHIGGIPMRKEMTRLLIPGTAREELDDDTALQTTDGVLEQNFSGSIALPKKLLGTTNAFWSICYTPQVRKPTG